MVEARCLDDLDANGTELDDPLEELYQDLYHRLIEEPGSNPDDPDRGYGIVGKLSSAARQGTPPEKIARGIESEFRKDVRVHNTRATITKASKEEYDIAIAVVADEGQLGIKLVASGAGVRRVL